MPVPQVLFEGSRRKPSDLLIGMFRFYDGKLGNY